MNPCLRIFHLQQDLMVVKNKYSTENRFSEQLKLPVVNRISRELHILENLPEDRQFPDMLSFFLARINKCSLPPINRFVQFLSQSLLVIIEIPRIFFKSEETSWQGMFPLFHLANIFNSLLFIAQAVIFHIAACLIKMLQILCIGFILYFVFPKGMLSIISDNAKDQ